MPLNFTLSLLFYEVKLAFTLAILLYLWYMMGLLNFVVKLLCIAEMQRVTRLPIEIDTLIVDLSGSAIITGIKVMPPPIVDDSRWELAHIISIDFIRVHFPFFPAFLFFFLSWGELVILDDISIHGLRFYIEGYRESDGKLSFNVNLIGKRKTEDPLPDGIDQLTTLYGLDTVILHENYFSGTIITPSNRHNQKVDFSQPKTEKNVKTENSLQTESFPQEQPSLRNWASKMFSYAETEIGHHGGLFNAAIHRAKRAVDRKIHEKIASLHIHLVGEEPKKTVRGMRIISRHVHYDYIEINLVRALPISLRRLERKPLIVEKLDFTCLGFEHVPLTPLLPVTRVNPITQANPVIQSNPVSRASYISRSNSLSQEKPHFFSSFSSTSHHNTQTENETENHVEVQPEPQQQQQQFPQRRHIDYLNLPVNTAGLDARIFKYWFERKLLFALYKSNASRLAIDALHLSTWTASSSDADFSPFEHFLNHETTTEDDDDDADEREQQEEQQAMLDEYEEEIEAHLREQQQKKNGGIVGGQRKIISSHPIFFS